MTQHEDGSGGEAPLPHSAPMPWWVRAITFFGVPSAIAIGLVFQLSTAITHNSQSTLDVLQAHAIEAQQRDRDHHEHERALEKILRAICVQGADTFEARRDCVQ
jgi:hypothetical protein